MSPRHLVFRGHLAYLCHFWDCLLAPVPRYWSKSGKEFFWFPDCWSNLLHSNFAWVKNQTYSKKTWAKDLKEQMIKWDKKKFRQWNHASNLLGHVCILFLFSKLDALWKPESGKIPYGSQSFIIFFIFLSKTEKRTQKCYAKLVY